MRGARENSARAPPPPAPRVNVPRHTRNGESRQFFRILHWAVLFDAVSALGLVQNKQRRKIPGPFPGQWSRLKENGYALGGGCQLLQPNDIPHCMLPRVGGCFPFGLMKYTLMSYSNARPGKASDPLWKEKSGISPGAQLVGILVHSCME